jgi:phosphohistidine swiveling domain-containing protein
MITRDESLKTLLEITGDDLPRVGGKAFNCARLKQAGIPVPNGIVIPSDATDAGIRDSHLTTWISKQPADMLFAVRSSGLGEDGVAHSFAGMHETLLGIASDAVIEAVMICRRSAQSEQANAYRQARQLDAEASIAVLVQCMVPAICSGVAFTINPVSGNDEFVINAALGLGCDLVNGQIDPDEYRVSKSEGSVLAARLSSAKGAEVSSILSTEQTRSLAMLLTRIETLYGSPQDVEWCHDGEQFWIVQSRPITAAVKSSSAHLNLQSQSQKPEVEWTRANFAEILPDQTSPQVIKQFAAVVERAQRRHFGRLLAPESELGPVVKVFNGRLYLNLSQMRRVTDTLGVSFAKAVLRPLGHPEAIRAEDDVPPRLQLGRLLRALPDVMRIAKLILRAPKIVRDIEATVEATIAPLSVDLDALSNHEIWSLLECSQSAIPEALKAVLVTSSAAQHHEANIRKTCDKVGFESEKLIFPQLAAGKRSVSTQQAVDIVSLVEIARQDPSTERYLLTNDSMFSEFGTVLKGTSFLAAFEVFLATYGHRGRYESDWSLPRLHENPAPVLFAIRTLLQGEPKDMEAIAASQSANAAASLADFEQALTPWQRRRVLPNVRTALGRLKQQHVWREKVRSDLTLLTSKQRTLHLALANRFVDQGWIERRDDYFLLHLEEVEAAITDPQQSLSLRRIVSERTAQLAVEQPLRMPLFMRESELPTLLRTSRLAAMSEGELTGLCVSPGAVESEVVVIRDPSEFMRMRRGAILVAPATDPSWTPIFTLASGIIVEVGGMLSHASTIAREYGLPALTNVKQATQLLTTGDRVLLDASAGRVVQLSHQPLVNPTE